MDMIKIIFCFLAIVLMFSMNIALTLGEDVLTCINTDGFNTLVKGTLTYNIPGTTTKYKTYDSCTTKNILLEYGCKNEQPETLPNGVKKTNVNPKNSEVVIWNYDCSVQGAYCDSGICKKYAYLNDYPKMFNTDKKFNGVIVVGENAQSKEALAVAEIAVGLVTRVTGSEFSKEVKDISGLIISLDTFKTDTEVLDITSKNTILVGGPCSNAATAAALGNPEDCTIGLKPGNAIIKLIDNGQSVSLIVAGYTAEDTRIASKFLMEWWNKLGNQKNSEILIETII